MIDEMIQEVEKELNQGVGLINHQIRGQLKDTLKKLKILKKYYEKEMGMLKSGGVS